MARADSAKVRMDRWSRELTAAEKVYTDWTKDYSTDRLESFVVKSRQWVETAKKTDPYLVNLLLPSLDARMPALMFDTPHVIVAPRAAKADDVQPMAAPIVPDVMTLLGVPTTAPVAPPAVITAEKKARLREDLINTIISDKKSMFGMETALALREAFFRFGMVEVYYTAELQDLRMPEPPPSDGGLVLPEPEAAATPPGGPLGPDGLPAPVPTSSAPLAGPDASSGPAPSSEPPEGENLVAKLPRRAPKPGSERVKFRRIPAKTVRVSANCKNDLGRCDWVAYWEWKYIDDVKANPNYKNKDGLRANYSLTEQVVGTKVGDGSEKDGPPADGMVKIWKLWSIREKKRYVWADGQEKFLVDGKPYNFIPLAALKFIEILDEFYPVPVAFNWTGPQIEYNETRDTMRTHRKRALRKYIYKEGITDEALKNLSSGQDMAFAKVPVNIQLSDAIQAVEPAPMDQISAQQVAMTRQEVFETTRVGGEARQVADSGTARQASIIAVSKQVQDSMDRKVVSTWLTDLCWIALRTAEENITFGALVKTSVDLTAPGAELETRRLDATWQMIQMDDLGDLEYEVGIDIESLAPANSTLVAQVWDNLLGVLANPAVLAILGRSEVMLRKYLATRGIREEEDIQEILRVAQELTMPMGIPGMPPGTPGAPPLAGAPGVASQPALGIPGDQGAAGAGADLAALVSQMGAQ